MNRSWVGPLITGLIVIGVAAILVFNFQPDRDSKKLKSVEPIPKPSSSGVLGQNVKENPIGDPVIKNHIQVNAVWLAGVTMEGMRMAADVIHLEADIKSTEDNPATRN